MKRPGKPDTGNPSVRFDEGSESDGHWLTPFNPSAPAYSTTGLRATLRAASVGLKSRICGRGNDFSDCPLLMDPHNRQDMANTYSQSYLQVVFAVEGRQNLIQKPN